MAVVDYRIKGLRVAMRHFEVPKRAGELKYWYIAAQKACPQMPKFEPRFLVNADITVETIILGWENHGVRHDVYIARKRRLM